MFGKAYAAAFEAKKQAARQKAEMAYQQKMLELQKRLFDGMP